LLFFFIKLIGTAYGTQVDKKGLQYAKKFFAFHDEWQKGKDEWLVLDVGCWVLDVVLSVLGVK
jgi:hypothetical protein